MINLTIPIWLFLFVILYLTIGISLARQFAINYISAFNIAIFWPLIVVLIFIYELWGRAMKTRHDS